VAKPSRVLALTSTAQRVPELRAHGIVPLLGNLDNPATLRRLAGLATRVIQLAPPPSVGDADPRTTALLRVLQLKSRPQSFVYASTTGVYGNCDGAIATETRAVNAYSARAIRRLHAERSTRNFGQTSGVRSIILRVPGIYAPDREGGTPQQRLSRGTAVLLPNDDVYTNHIHANDLARACLAALWRGQPQRIYNVNDDTCLKMGDYFDQAADLYGLPRPPRVSRIQAQSLLSPMQLSFMRESRRMDNTRMKKELRLHLLYPSVWQGLAAIT
jgi:nucleoside-diphosphate-sugar epimerase